MKLGSLFDGSGTAPLAATMCGIEPVWASEIEPYPIKVTTARFPDWWEAGVEGSDSARYKMWGNGMALPNMLHVMKGIAMAEQWAGGAREAIL